DYASTFSTVVGRSVLCANFAYPYCPEKERGMTLRLSTLPAFNGADQDSAAMTYGIFPDPDGHSVWAVLSPFGDPPDDINSSVQYTVAKIDLNTKTVMKKWLYPDSTKPITIAEGTPFFFVDASGKVWTVPAVGSGAGKL